MTKLIKKTNRGFTLIELLVVIAIIGILASVVLASLNSARDRAQDSKIKTELAQLRSEAELIYDSSSSYDVVCDDGTAAETSSEALLASVEGANGTGTVVCNDSANEYAALSPYRSDTAIFWCVDSTGASREVTTTITTETVCPAP